MRTNDLRALIRDVILDATNVNNVAYGRVDNVDMYPHISFVIDRASYPDLNRYDYQVIIDVWDRGESDVAAEDLADKVENAFNAENLPQDTILPTFFLEARRTVPDEDKLIKHVQIELITQSYEVI